MRTSLLLLMALLSAFEPGSAQADVDIRIGGGGTVGGCSPVGSNIQAAINASDPVLGVTNLLIARDATYTAQQLDISGKNIRLIGGYATCQQASAGTTRTVISGFGGGSNSVITIRGSTSRVELRNLDITAGDEVTGTNGFGGGIDISGGPHPYVYLENVRIQNSVAGYGGGISMKNSTPSNQGAVTLVLFKNNLITQNDAGQSGGGIYCENSRIEMVGSNNAIHDNGAGNGSGGGMRLQNCIVNLASRNPFFGTVSLNTASGSGGGISITGERASLTMFNLLPDAPTLISGNIAGGVGGGIDIGSSARVYGFDVIIDGNTARNGGGGISVFDNDGDYEDRARLLLQGTLNGAPAAAVNCTAALDCNRVSDNIARSLAGTDQGGAALRVEGVFDPGVPGTYGYTETLMFGTRISRNSGRSAVHLTDGLSISRFDGVLIDNNTVDPYLLHNASEGTLEITGSTIARNTVTDAVIRTDPDAQLKRSLVWQPGVSLFSLVNGSIQAGRVEHVLTNSLANAPASSTNRIVTQSEVAFVDAAAGNFRLQAGSVGLDYAPMVAGATRDGFPRHVDIPQDPNGPGGSQDVGAYEKQSADGYNSAPAISVAGPLTAFEDSNGTLALQGFSLSDPDGDIEGALTVTAPIGFGDMFGLYFDPVTATQLSPSSIVIEGPLSRINDDTATFAGFTIYSPPRDFFGAVPITLNLSDQGNTGLGGVLSAQATLTVTVLPVNDAPTLQIPDLLRATADVGTQTVELAPVSTISVGPPNEGGQLVQAWALLSTQDSQGVLSATPTLGPAGKLAFSLSGVPGVVELSARIVDDGGTENGGVANSAPATFHIRVSVDGTRVFSDGFEGSN